MCPFRRFQQHNFELAKIIPQERVSECMREQVLYISNGSNRGEHAGGVSVGTSSGSFGVSRANSGAHHGKNHPRPCSTGEKENARSREDPSTGASAVTHCGVSRVLARTEQTTVDEGPQAQSSNTVMDIPVVPRRQLPVDTVCRHAFCGVTPGAHGSEGADDTRRAPVAGHR